MPVAALPENRARAGTGRTLPAALRRVVLVAAVAALVLVTAAFPAGAAEPTGSPIAPGAPELNQVIDALRGWLVGLLAALATLFLTIGGLRYMTAGGDPGEIERAKTALKSAAIGYALAALAPLFVEVLQSVVGA